MRKMYQKTCNLINLHIFPTSRSSMKKVIEFGEKREKEDNADFSGQLDGCEREVRRKKLRRNANFKGRDK